MTTDFAEAVALVAQRPWFTHAVGLKSDVCTSPPELSPNKLFALIRVDVTSSGASGATATKSEERRVYYSVVDLRSTELLDCPLGISGGPPLAAKVTDGDTLRWDQRFPALLTAQGKDDSSSCDARKRSIDYDVASRVRNHPYKLLLAFGSEEERETLMKEILAKGTLTNIVLGKLNQPSGCILYFEPAEQPASASVDTSDENKASDHHTTKKSKKKKSKEDAPAPKIDEPQNEGASGAKTEPGANSSGAKTEPGANSLGSANSAAAATSTLAATHVRVVEPQLPKKEALVGSGGTMLLPKTIDVGFAQLTITAKSVSVEEVVSPPDVSPPEEDGGEAAAAQSEQDEIETAMSVVGEVFAAQGSGEIIGRIVWYCCSLRSFWNPEKKIMPQEELEAAIVKHSLKRVYIRKGRSTFRSYAVNRADA
jgi:hypothetical protein